MRYPLANPEQKPRILTSTWNLLFLKGEGSGPHVCNLQSRPCPGGLAVGWWSSLRGPTPQETQSRPGRSPCLVTSPSVSANRRATIVHFHPASLPTPALCFLFCSEFSCVLPLSLRFRVSRGQTELWGGTEVPAWLFPDLCALGSHLDSLGSVFLICPSAK